MASGGGGPNHGRMSLEQPVKGGHLGWGRNTGASGVGGPNGRMSLGGVEECRGIWGGGTQWKDVTWWVGVHLGGHFFLIQEYMSSKERMGVMRYSGGY